MKRRRTTRVLTSGTGRAEMEVGRNPGVLSSWLMRCLCTNCVCRLKSCAGGERKTEGRRSSPVDQAVSKTSCSNCAGSCNSSTEACGELLEKAERRVKTEGGDGCSRGGEGKR